MLKEFIDLGGRGFVKRVFESSAEIDEEWSTLFDMQHYEVPTRLLDWTTTLGVAIAFALMDRDGTDGAAAIYVLDPSLSTNAAKLRARESLRLGKMPILTTENTIRNGQQTGSPKIPLQSRHRKTTGMSVWLDSTALLRYTAGTLDVSKKCSLEPSRK